MEGETQELGRAVEIGHHGFYRFADKVLGSRRTGKMHQIIDMNLLWHLLCLAKIMLQDNDVLAQSFS